MRARKTRESVRVHVTSSHVGILRAQRFTRVCIRPALCVCVRMDLIVPLFFLLNCLSSYTASKEQCMYERLRLACFVQFVFVFKISKTRKNYHEKMPSFYSKATAEFILL